MALRRPDRLFFVTVAVLVAAAGVALTFTGSSPAPRHINEWYAGSWRFTGPMIGLQQGRLVQRPAAPPGVVRVIDDNNVLSVSMKGFPGVSSATVPGRRTPIEVDFQTPDVGQGVGFWSLALHSGGNGLLRLYDPLTDTGVWMPLARQ